jgi:hypothetical protein
MDKKINLFVEPVEFFKERITETMEKQKLSTTPTAEFYLVELLTRFMFAKNLFENSDPEQNDQEQADTNKPHHEDPLAILLLKAQTGGVDFNEKIKLLKKLGDTSLYISGFFGDSLNRKVIDLDYYREMGSVAYRSLSGTIRDDAFQALYRELYEKFSGFVDVLTEISQESFVQSNQNLLKLYENYARTGSEFAKKQLAEHGLPVSSSMLTPFLDKKSKN